MIVGLDKFKTWFADHADDYVLIGGAACDLLFTRAGLPFRATKDLDVVLCVEMVSAAFAARFVEFLDAADYRSRAISEGVRRYFRFSDPANTEFPFMIELFARPSAAADLPDTDTYVRLGVEDDIVSLSAVLLDADYYAALKNGRTIVDGVTILNETLIVPFKARAFLDLSARKASGEQIDSRNIRKHRNDVFRLVLLLPGEGEVPLPVPLKEDLLRFIGAMANEEFDPETFAVPLSKEECIGILRRVYGL